MKLIIAAFILSLSFQSFAHDRHEERRGERRDERRSDRREPRHDTDPNIFDISNTLIVTSYTFDDQKVATQIFNDAQDFIQTGNMSLLLDQTINGIQKSNGELSLEDSLDLILTLTK